MNPEARLAEIVAALEAVGLNCLVMGGHAVRFHGVDRNTGDFDLHLAPDCWDDLLQALSRSSLFAGRPLIEDQRIYGKSRLDIIWIYGPDGCMVNL